MPGFKTTAGLFITNVLRFIRRDMIQITDVSTIITDLGQFAGNPLINSVNSN